MKGYVACKGTRWYAVVYEGVDPISGREHRSWHAAGTERADAEWLSARLASERKRSQRQRPFAQLRRVPDQSLASQQAPRAGHEHL
jgi:hypothetical protein